MFVPTRFQDAYSSSLPPFPFVRNPATRSESIEIPPSAFESRQRKTFSRQRSEQTIVDFTRNDATISKETENSPTIMQSRVKVKRHPFMAVCALAVLVAAGASRLTLTPRAIYMATNQQVIDGFGFSTACAELLRRKNQSLYGTLACL